MAPPAKLDLIDCIDALAEVRRLMRGAWMAAGSLQDSDAEAIQTVLNAADDKIREVEAGLTAQAEAV